MGVAAFPTSFPADAASKIGQAILAKQFTTDLIEPIYDLIGFGLFKLFGQGGPPTPFPRPTLGAAAPGESDVEEVGRMLSAACEQHDDGLKAAPNVAALPWGQILSALFTILQGLFLAVGPSPFPKPTPAPQPQPAPQPAPQPSPAPNPTPPAQ